MKVINKGHKREKIIIGWKEWCSLPLLGIGPIEAKIDTGAATSAIHARVLDILEKDHKKVIKFIVFTHNKFNKDILCEAPFVDYKYIMSSNGMKEQRYVIKTQVSLGKIFFETAITLTDRSPLRYPMLLGRMALKRKFLIDPALAQVQGKPMNINGGNE